MLISLAAALKLLMFIFTRTLHTHTHTLTRTRTHTHTRTLLALPAASSFGIQRSIKVRISGIYKFCQQFSLFPGKEKKRKRERDSKGARKGAWHIITNSCLGWHFASIIQIEIKCLANSPNRNLILASMGRPPTSLESIFPGYAPNFS